MREEKEREGEREGEAKKSRRLFSQMTQRQYVLILRHQTICGIFRSVNNVANCMEGGFNVG